MERSGQEGGTVDDGGAGMRKGVETSRDAPRVVKGI
jgi:hypothetical protein